MTQDDTRLGRYEAFLNREYYDGLRRPSEYDSTGITPSLWRFLQSGKVRRIVFSGMGCSAIVSELIRGFLASTEAPTVYVLNDFDPSVLVPDELLDDGTLLILSSYSGHSVEPMKLYEAQVVPRHQTLVLTSGGALAAAAVRDSVSVVYWRLTNADREYPLFHVPQYFAILMTVLSELGLTNVDVPRMLSDLSIDLDAFAATMQQSEVDDIADKLFGANIVMVAPPVWHEALLKLAKMHFNEIAMVPATRNYLHEFCHSEVAVFTHPEIAQAILMFADVNSDPYSNAKAENLAGLIGARARDGAAVRIARIEVNSADFVGSYFRALLVIQHVTLELGRRRVVQSADLISSAAGNPWYSTARILADHSTGTS